jgi:cytochrome bd-type quinol oxidase subunit 2
MTNWGAAPPPYRPVPPYQQWPDRARRRVAPGVLFGVTMWRLLIVVFAIVGFGLAMRDATGSDALAALSQQASLVTAICYGFLLLFPVFTGGRRHEPDTPWLRGALTVLLSLVSITFLTMLGGDLSQTWSLFEHVLTPAVVLLDWLVVGRDQRNARWWYPISWLAFPLAYLLFYVAYVGNGPPIYPFLDPAASDFLGVVFEFLGGVLVFGFVVYGLGKLHGRGRR